MRTPQLWFRTGLRTSPLFRITDEVGSWYTFSIDKKHIKCIFFPQPSQPVPERQPVPSYQTSESPPIYPDGSFIFEHRILSRLLPSYPITTSRLSINSVQNIPWYHRSEKCAIHRINTFTPTRPNESLENIAFEKNHQRILWAPHHSSLPSLVMMWVGCLILRSQSSSLLLDLRPFSGAAPCCVRQHYCIVGNSRNGPGLAPLRSNSH